MIILKQNGNWDIIPGSDDAKARKIAEQVRAMVDMLPSVEDMIMDLADAIGHGFAALVTQRLRSHPNITVAPGEVTEKQLEELHIAIVRDEKEQ